MYKRVVVPLDGSRLAEEMLRFIVDIAQTEKRLASKAAQKTAKQ